MLNNPGGATSARIRFGLVNATDDWWWAVDNIRVGIIPEPGSAALAGLALFGLGLVRRRR
jgi:PEP-CTERM motif-containing protein